MNFRAEGAKIHFQDFWATFYKTIFPIFIFPIYDHLFRVLGPHKIFRKNSQTTWFPTKVDLAVLKMKSKVLSKSRVTANQRAKNLIFAHEAQDLNFTTLEPHSSRSATFFENFILFDFLPLSTQKQRARRLPT